MPRRHSDEPVLVHVHLPYDARRAKTSPTETYLRTLQDAAATPVMSCKTLDLGLRPPANRNAWRRCSHTGGPLRVAPTVQWGLCLVTPGQTLGGRFLLVEQIGRGGMSTVFKAEDLQNENEVVVVKVPLPIFSSGVGSWSIFQREEEIGRQLDHPFVLKFIQVAQNKRRSYVVTEYVPGHTLAARLDRHRPLPEADALLIAAQICAALDHIHGRGFVHYDLKPANVILCPDGTIRLIDFGLAHAVETSRFAFSGPPPAIGSSDYVAPEQIRRKRGRKSVDIYGVGALLYEMLTGQAPFPGDDPFVVASARTLGDPAAPRTVNPRISRQAEEIALRALRRAPAQRYPSAAAMKADLDHSDQVSVLGLCDHLSPVTRGRRALRIARYVVLVGVVPLATQVVLFLLLWHHFGRRP